MTGSSVQILGSEYIDRTARRLGRAANAIDGRSEKLDKAYAALGQAVAKLAFAAENFDARYDSEPVVDAELLALAETRARGALLDMYEGYADLSAFVDAILYKGEPEADEDEVSA